MIMHTEINLGFGCASIMGRYGKRESLNILAAAYNSGIHHFDVARSYGYGEAESLLGNFLQGRSDKTTIATKFGVLPSRKAKLFSFAKPLVRPFIKHKPPSSQDITFDNENIIDEKFLRKSLNQSLSALKTDRIDILFVHEPNQNWRIPDNLTLELQQLVDSGVISDWGISGYFPSIKKILAINPSFSHKIQTNANLFNYQDVINTVNLYATFSPFHRGYIANTIDYFLSDKNRASTLSQLLGFDVTQKGSSYLALFLIRPFIKQNIILSTISPSKMKNNIQATLDAKDLKIHTAVEAINLIKRYKDISDA